MSSLPLISHPAKIVWVDDDKLFLHAGTEIFKDDFNLQVYHSAQDCLQFFGNYCAISANISLLKGYQHSEDYDLINHFPVDVNLESILQLRNNFKRFQDVAVLIVDYHMPDMTGLELCFKLRGLPIKKILLTGAASHQQAVDAFNNGIIDCYIRKDDPGFVNDVKTYIERLHEKYFVELTRHLLCHLEADYKIPQSDPVFRKFFYEWCKKNEVVEFYLSDKNGSFMTINKSGLIQYFVAHTDRSLTIFKNLYEDDIEVSSFVQAVEKRSRIPFFGLNKESWDFEFKDWLDHFYPPNIFEGRERYYWIAVREEQIS